MSETDQNELPLFGTWTAPVAEPDPNIAFLISVLYRQDWLTAREVIARVFIRTQVVWTDRKVRELASFSQGKIAGGQRGYKLVEQMTREEFNHARNWMSAQAAEMQRRVIEMDKVWFARKPVAKGAVG